jgi:[acyl-carrier-protein] S-malonyltransferase
MPRPAVPQRERHPEPSRESAPLRLAMIHPGQGSQSVGMGRELARVSPEAGAVWAEVDEVLGEPLARLAWEGPADQLDLTVNAQPALLAASVAAHRALRAAADRAGDGAAFQPDVRAGHSMGQYSAMVAAGTMSLADGLRLVRQRGRLMQEASPDGAMAAIIGLEEAREPELLAAGTATGVLTIANRNSPGQIVISGDRAAVTAATEAARDLGARRAIVLPVSVAAHSRLMEPAAAGMRRTLAPIGFADPDVPLLANADAASLATADACRAELIDHLTKGVDWVRSVRAMVDAGVDTFLEVGPGKVLTGLVRRIAPAGHAFAIDDLVTADGLDLTPLIEPALVPQTQE